MTSLKGIKLADIKRNRVLTCQIEVPKNHTVAHVSDLHSQSNLIFDKNGSSKSNCYEYLNNNINQEGRYPLVCKKWADKPTARCLNDPLMQIHNQGKLPNELTIPTAQNQSDFNRPQNCNVNLFHLVDVVYPAKIGFDRTNVYFQHEFDSCGKEQTRVRLKIPFGVSGTLQEFFYRHLLENRDGGKNCLVNIYK